MMKTLITFLLILSSSVTFCQSFALCKAANGVTRGIPTSLNIVSPDIPCDSIILQTKSGTIVKNGCNLVFTATDSAMAYIGIYYKKKGKTIEAKNYSLKVNEQDKPLSTAGAKGLKIKKETLIAYGAVTGMLNVTETQADPILVYSYLVVVFRNEKQLLGRINYGRSFDAKTLEVFNTLQTGDLVLFANIKTGYNGKDLQAAPVEYIIE
jgi:hypothetical protein